MIFLDVGFNWQKALYSVIVILVGGGALTIAITYFQLYLVSKITKSTIRKAAQILELRGVMSIVGVSVVASCSIALFIFMKVY